MKMQKIFLFLSVTILLLAGCGGKEEQVTEERSVETETLTAIEESEAEEAVTEEAETEAAEESEPEESASAEDKKPEEGSSEAQTSQTAEKEQDSQNQGNTQNEPSQPQTAGQDTKPEPEPQPTQEPQQPAQPEPVSYSPQRVVQLATEKTKAAGKIYIPDDLDRMLAEGTLSQEDYNACYPTDGAGYLEYYVATDLNEARDVSGTVKFDSEDDIAANIAGMYGSLPQQYFYIEYHGTETYGGKECYVFYCYRA